MPTDKLRSILRPIWAWVSGGAILLSTLVWGIFSDRFRARVSPVVDWSLDRPMAIWRWIGLWHSLPGWGIVIGSLGSLAALTLVAVMVKEQLKRQSYPPHLRYTSDIFEGLRWRWDWAIGRISLNPFCVKCDQAVVSMYSHTEPWTMILGCEYCGNRVRITQPCEDLRNRVWRSIDRKCRSGEWKATLPN